MKIELTKDQLSTIMNSLAHTERALSTTRHEVANIYPDVSASLWSKITAIQDTHKEILKQISK